LVKTGKTRADYQCIQGLWPHWRHGRDICRHVGHPDPSLLRLRGPMPAASLDMAPGQAQHQVVGSRPIEGQAPAPRQAGRPDLRRPLADWSPAEPFEMPIETA